MKRLYILFYLLTSAILMTGQTPERLPDMNVPRTGHNVFFANGELTVVGGHTSGFVMTPTAEYFSDGSWHLMKTVYQHDNGMATVLDDNRRVLLAGGHDKNLGIGQSFEVEMYDSEKHTFEGFGSLNRNRAFAQGVSFGDNQVLIAGNHKGNDAFEIFDGKKSFHHSKYITVWRSMPYLLPIANGDAICFGSVWRNRFEPCDTVDRLNGEPFTVPLLNEWMPFLYTQNSHATASFIGDKAADDYSYLIAAQNPEGKVAFIHIKDTVFSLLHTTVPVPTATEWGRIKYDRVAVADRQAKRAYLIGTDTTSHVCIVTVEYDKQPAPLTFYVTEPLPDFGDTNPILTPDGDLVVTGGITNDNFAPYASVWLFHTGTQQAMMTAGKSLNVTLICVLCGLMLIGIAVLIVVRNRKRATDKPDTLMPRIIELMETKQLYLNPDLKVSDVATALGVHRNAVSASINAQKGCSFNQFVNEYRIGYAKKLLRETSDIKISAISIESGFATESTFFRVFKTATGMSPKEWANS